MVRELRQCIVNVYPFFRRDFSPARSRSVKIKSERAATILSILPTSGKKERRFRIPRERTKPVRILRKSRRLQLAALTRHSNNRELLARVNRHLQTMK